MDRQHNIRNMSVIAHVDHGTNLIPSPFAFVLYLIVPIYI